ncbi:MULTISPECIES: hypothetical protein [unclassified Clostridium]|uniref:hypothetical protein n=1 Tax=unclassified Clostridium TaxID=2614128 RepID=UPI0025BBBE1B|nr:MULTISPECIES: hypothetical protein [unclassified Clostridium]
MNNEEVTLRELEELLHYRKLDKSVKIKVGEKIYNITGITENSKDEIFINGEES